MMKRQEKWESIHNEKKTENLSIMNISSIDFPCHQRSCRRFSKSTTFTTLMLVSIADVSHHNKARKSF